MSDNLTTLVFEQLGLVRDVSPKVKQQSLLV